MSHVPRTRYGQSSPPRECPVRLRALPVRGLRYRASVQRLGAQPSNESNEVVLTAPLRTNSISRLVVPILRSNSTGIVKCAITVSIDDARRSTSTRLAGTGGPASRHDQGHLRVLTLTVTVIDRVSVQRAGHRPHSRSSRSPVGSRPQIERLQERAKPGSDQRALDRVSLPDLLRTRRRHASAFALRLGEVRRPRSVAKPVRLVARSELQ